MVVLDERLREPLNRELIALFENGQRQRLFDMWYVGLRNAYPEFAQFLLPADDPVIELERAIESYATESEELAISGITYGIQKALHPRANLDPIRNFQESIRAILDIELVEIRYDLDYFVSLALAIKELSVIAGAPALQVASNPHFEPYVLISMYTSPQGTLSYFNERQQLETSRNTAILQHITLSKIYGFGSEYPDPLPMRALRMKHFGEVAYLGDVFDVVASR